MYKANSYIFQFLDFVALWCDCMCVAHIISEKWWKFWSLLPSILVMKKRISLTHTHWLRSSWWGETKKRRERKKGRLCAESIREGINYAGSLSRGPALGHRWVLGHSRAQSAMNLRITEFLRTFPVQWPSTGTDCTERVRSIPHWRYSRTVQIQSCVMCSWTTLLVQGCCTHRGPLWVQLLKGKLEYICLW